MLSFLSHRSRWLPSLLLLGTVLCASAGTAHLSIAAEVVILKSSDARYYAQAVEGFRKTVPPKTQVTEQTLPDSAIGARELGQMIRAEHPDLVLTVGLKATLMAKAEIPDIPVLFCLVLNPESHGLPASNMTGISVKVPLAAQLDQIKRLTPQIRRIGLLHGAHQDASTIQTAKQHAKSLGVQLIAAGIEGPVQLPDALRALLSQAELLLLLPDQAVVTEESIPLLLNSTLDAKVPVFGFSSTLVQRGALGALVVEPQDIGEQAGRMVASLLQRPPAGETRLLQPDHPRLALNLNTAEFLGFAPPPDMIRMATRVFGGPGAFASRQERLEVIP